MDESKVLFSDFFSDLLSRLLPLDLLLLLFVSPNTFKNGLELSLLVFILNK